MIDVTVPTVKLWQLKPLSTDGDDDDDDEAACCCGKVNTSQKLTTIPYGLLVLFGNSTHSAVSSD